MSQSANFQLNDFIWKKTLSTNVTQKRVVVLGDCADKQGQAILIINAKIPSQKQHKYTKIQQAFQNDIYSKFDVTMEGEYQIQAMFPVTQKHKNKYRQKTLVMVKETAEKYLQKREALLKKQLSHIDWIYNILDGKAESERVLMRNQKFVILPDYAYSDLSQVDNMHLLVISCDPNLHSLRELRGSHIQLLEQIQNQINKVTKQKFGLNEGHCRMFFHYPPTFYRLHIHVTNLKVHAMNARVERAHLLQNVIQNLKIDSEYYLKISLQVQVQLQQ